MKRYIQSQVLKDLGNKMVFITGPRQVGKTYLAKEIIKEFKYPQYLNYDNVDHRKIIANRTWPINFDLLVFDEIHKMKNWKIYLKGIYDAKSKNQSILVTGSGRMETFRQSGESLAGRYYHIHLYPLSVKEVSKGKSPYNVVEKLNKLGAFPEPYFSGSCDEANRWRNQYYTDLIREDIIDFRRIQEVKSMKLLLELLRERVGSPLSYTALAQDLLLSPNTVKKYIHILESLYIIFLLYPFHKKIARSIVREPKMYFFDSGFIKGDEGIKFENTCAVCLLKYITYERDIKGKDISLNYIRTKDKKEIDFVIVKDGAPKTMFEMKYTKSNPSKTLYYFLNYLPATEAIQLVHNLNIDIDEKGIQIRQAGKWLSQLPV